MKPHTRLMMCLAVAVPMLTFACQDEDTLAPAPDPERSFVVTMTGAKEKPNAISPAGTGSATFTLNAAETQLDYSISVSGMTSNITASHIHLGNANVAGSVIIGLTTPVNGGTVTGSITSTTALGLGLSFKSLIDLIRNGDTYVNVHTSNNTGGEIRGQIDGTP
jgi:hypothetical protein